MSTTRERTRVNFDLDQIRKDLDQEPWEEFEQGRDVRRVYLGSWISLSPSGKIYAPFANSNVNGCGGCNGTGKHRAPGSRRVVNKITSHGRQVRRLAVKRFGYHFEGKWPKIIRVRLDRIHRTSNRLAETHCYSCGGTGSREAHLDDLWRNNVIEAFDAKGMCFDEDGEDLFASEYRDIPVETG